MTNNLLRLPSYREDDALVSLADWVELTAYFSEKKSASKEDLQLALQRTPIDEDDNARPKPMSDEAVEAKANDVFLEIQDRAASCTAEDSMSPTYPFKIDAAQALITMPEPENYNRNLLYLFLLCMTVASMDSKNRKKAGCDPTKLFELLCGDILRCFWGGKADHADVMIFGTAKSGEREKKFKKNIERLCENLGEGGGWNENAHSPGGGDGSLDLVATGSARWLCSM